jgi:hypothetical protein
MAHLVGDGLVDDANTGELGGDRKAQLVAELLVGGDNLSDRLIEQHLTLRLLAPLIRATEPETRCRR